MTPELEDALAHWETGDLSRDELARRFPDEDIAGLLSTFDAMQALATGPTPDATRAWDSIREELPIPLARHRRRRPKPIRLLAVALVALLVMGASAYAFVPGVRRAVSEAVGLVTGSEDLAPRPTGLTPGPAPADEGTAVEPDGNDGNTQNDDQGEGDDTTDQQEGEDEGTGSEQGSDDGGSTDEDTQEPGAASQEGSDEGDQDTGGQGDGQGDRAPSGDEKDEG